MTKPFQCSSRTKENAYFVNILTAYFLPAVLPLDPDINAQVRVSWYQPVDEASQTWAGRCYVHMNGLWRIEFSNLDFFSLHPLLNEWLAADASNQYALLPEGLRAAVTQRLFVPTLDAISRYTGLPPVFVGPPPESSQAGFSDAIHVQLAIDDRPTTCVRIAWQDTATLYSLLEVFQGQPLRAPQCQHEWLLQAPVSSHLLIGEMSLTKDEVIKLEPGDILLPTPFYPLEPLFVLARDQVFSCELHEHLLTITGPVAPRAATSGEKRESDMSQSDTTAEPLLSQEGLQALALDIRFELPGIQLTLEQAGRLVAGQTFTLEHDVRTMPVRVCIAGRQIAQGQLVDVGGKAGVQLTQVFAKAVEGNAE